MRAFALLLCCASALAQDLTPRARAQSQDLILEHATIHTISHGTIEGASLVLRAGKVHAVSTGDVEGAGERIECRGKHVYPGLIGARTAIGLLEIGQVRATNDTREIGDATPEVLACVAVNPDSTVIPVTRSNGILSIGVFPQGGTVPGRASVLALEGWTAAEMTLLADAGLSVTWPAMRARKKEELERRDEALRALDELFASARSWLAARAADPAVPIDIRFDAMRETLARTRPVFVRADELEQIQSAVAWAKKRELRLVIVGGRDADLCTELLKREQVAVMLLGTHTLPRRAESGYDEPFKLPAVLEEAGIRWCLASGEEHAHERNLPYHAATAVAFGLPRAAALRSITLSAAEILGVADRVGSIDAGKDATVIVTDGDPLEITTRVEHAWIQGKRLDLSNKQTKLAEKYRAKYR